MPVFESREPNYLGTPGKLNNWSLQESAELNIYQDGLHDLILFYPRPIDPTYLKEQGGLTHLQDNNRLPLTQWLMTSVKW